MLLSKRDAGRVEAAVRYYENLVRGTPQQQQGSRRFFTQLPFRQFKLLRPARPGNMNSPTVVLAQPFLGDSVPQLAWESELDEDGNKVPVSEWIHHHIPGMYLCTGTHVWCLWAYSEWRIIHAEQWPVTVHQIEADGFPDGSVSCYLTLKHPEQKEPVEHAFEISTKANALELLAKIREHPLLKERKNEIQAAGGPLSYCAINIMYGPGLTGWRIDPLMIDNHSQPVGRGLKLRILSPLWAER